MREIFISPQTLEVNISYFIAFLTFNIILQRSPLPLVWALVKFDCCRSVSEGSIHIQVNEKFIFTSVSFPFPYLVDFSSKARVSGRQITCVAREHNA